jgi:Ca2+-binding RTX toxin-like protein
MRVIKRAWVASVVAVVGSLALADGAFAALSCDYDSGTKRLTVMSTGFEEVVALRRDGTDIEITDDAMGGELTCTGGTPTINNTDAIELSGPLAVAPAVYFDLKKGYMTPGVENESPELSEIEIDVFWPEGFFGVGGGNNVDRFTFGESGSGPALKMNNDSDTDALLGSTMSIILRGESGKDRLSGKGGGPGFTGPIEIPMTIEGGPGGDRIKGGGSRDVLYGEGGKDKLKGGDGRDIFEVEGGKKDKVKCGAGNDKVFADASDKIAGDCEKVDVS